VIVDTETTDLWGAVCELAVVDAHSGEVLIDTLVNPGIPIAEEARWVHGISDADVAGAPSWPEVLPGLLAVTKGRHLLAYGADYDAGVICSDTVRHGLDPAHLADGPRWGCVMDRRSDWARAWFRLPLEGGHRSLSDCRAALEVVRRIAGTSDGAGDRRQARPTATEGRQRECVDGTRTNHEQWRRGHRDTGRG
jgi:DNA polymerase III epsilon subunit-like protein